MNRMTLLRRVKSLLLTLCLAAVCLSVSAQELKQIDMEKDWGIQPVHIRVTAAGYMIEFRYKIMDTEKALIMSSRKLKKFPYLRALKSRARLAVPYGSTVGFLKSNRQFVEKGKNNIAMFSNEGQHLLPGDKVQIEVNSQLSPVLVLQ